MLSSQPTSFMHKRSLKTLQCIQFISAKSAKTTLSRKLKHNYHGAKKYLALIEEFVS